MEISKTMKTLITHPIQSAISAWFWIQCTYYNNLFNSQRFIFSSFKFDQFFDPTGVTGGVISWKLLHDVKDKDEKLRTYMTNASKLSYKTMNPGDNKESVPLALWIFDQGTSAAIESYNPNRLDASSFSKLVNTWWIINNSK